MLCLLYIIISTLSVTPVINGESFPEKRSSVFDEIVPDNPDTDACPEGTVLSEDSCLSCSSGMYADKSSGKCKVCPLDTYSEGSANTACKACGGNKGTVSLGSDDSLLCTDICEVPEARNSYYESANSILKTGDKVVSGTKIYFQCIDEDHTIIGTSFSYMTVTCTSDTSNQLPVSCVNTNDQSEIAGLICYDSCMEKTSGDITRLEMYKSGVISTILEKCPLSQCQVKDDVCVAVTYSTDNVKKVVYSCESSSSFDAEICLRAGVTDEECGIEKCSKDRCNDPDLQNVAIPQHPTLIFFTLSYYILSYYF